MISWVHVSDICRAFSHAISQDDMQGVFNIAAPAPVDNRSLMLTLAHATNGRWFLPIKVPSWLLRAVLGEMSVEVLKSATVSSRKISETGFTFLHPELSAAIGELAGSS